MPCQAVEIPFEQARRGHAAAVGASEAVDLAFDLLDELPQPAFDGALCPQVAAEALVLGALVLAGEADPDKGGDHQTTFTFLKSPARM